MIFDRTEADVKEALRLRAEKVQRGQLLTPEETAIMEKGFITYNTLNRIEDKQKELKTLLAQEGYPPVDFLSKTWGSRDFFASEDFDRIIANLNKLKEAFYVLPDTPPTPAPAYRYDVFNAIEKILFDIELLYGNMKAEYMYAGEIFAGEGF